MQQRFKCQRNQNLGGANCDEQFNCICIYICISTFFKLCHLEFYNFNKTLYDSTRHDRHVVIIESLQLRRNNKVTVNGY